MQRPGWPFTSRAALSSADGRRRTATAVPASRPRTADRLLATILHYRLHLPQVAIAALFSVRPETINKRIRDIRQLLDQAGHTIQPGPHRLARLDDLYNLATAAEITVQGARFGRTWCEIDDFTHAYGYDVRSWPGYPLLREIRDLHTLGSYSRRVRGGDQVARGELARRVKSLRAGDTTAQWQEVEPARGEPIRQDGLTGQA